MQSSKTPTHTVYVIAGPDDKKRWVEIGAAWRHKDGEGLSVNLDALPPSGRLVLRPTGQSLDQGGPQ